jgi:hypothetical protein
VELIPLNQEKEEVSEIEYDFTLGPEGRGWSAGENIAGFTGPCCPNPHRPVSAVRTGDSHFIGKEQKLAKKETWIYTKRCQMHERRMKRWQNGRADALKALVVSGRHPEAARVVFVTLTAPNYASSLSEASATRLFKKEVSDWRRSVGVLEHVLGGIDYFECTTNPDDGTRNAHCHGVWVMRSYWKQSEMLESWGRGGVRIEECRDPKRAAYYCTGYGSKSPVEGVRCKETFGACRGKAYNEIVSDAPDDFLTMLKGKAR